jgi:hypothetical protein
MLVHPMPFDTALPCGPRKVVEAFPSRDWSDPGDSVRQQSSFMPARSPLCRFTPESR